jgi:hypothetical protein
VAAPCWKSHLTDWSADGRVDHVYPVACYHRTVTHLHTDLEVYSSAHDDIMRALQRAVAGGGPKPHVVARGGALPLPLPLLVLAALALALLLAGALAAALNRRRPGRPR